MEFFWILALRIEFPLQLLIAMFDEHTFEYKPISLTLQTSQYQINIQVVEHRQ